MIYRSPRPDGNFYILDKSISEDARLSWAARGLLVFLLGKPDHWQVSPAALTNATEDSTKPTGRDGIYSLIAELIATGYITRTQERRTDGSLGPVQYMVNERGQPLTEKPEAAPHTAQPDTAQPLPANPTQASIDEKQGLKQARTESSTARASLPKCPIAFDPNAAEFTGISDEQMALWSKAYPGLNITSEFNRAACWLLANPSRAKSNYARFLNNWLKSATVTAPMRNAPTTPAQDRRDRREAFGAAITGGVRRSQTIDVFAEDVTDARPH